MTIYVFSEGKTEELVLKGIEKRLLPDLNLIVPAGEGKDQVNAGEGKDQVNHKMVATLAPNLQSSAPIRCLVLRDLDEHVGETVAGIVQGVSDAVRKMLQERMPEPPAVALSPLPDFPSVYTLALSRPDLRLALHIATCRWHEKFVKATIDDYVLSLAVQPTTASALVAKKGWPVTADDVLRKVTTEIPGLLVRNGIPLQEAKDYVRLYAAVIQEHTSPPVFAQRALAHADEADLRRVFAPLFAAIEFLRM